jgi:hypothetical protein
MSFLEDRTTRRPLPCPYCGENNDAALSMHNEPRPPVAGDTGICMSCTMPHIFQEVGPPRCPTESEWIRLNDDPDITKIRREIFMSHASLGNVKYVDKGTTVEGE